MRKFLFLSLLLFLGLIVRAQSPELTLFYGRECSHCEKELEFLTALKKEHPELKIVLFEVWHNQENQKLFAETAGKLGIKQLVVPLTVVGDKYLIGFDKAENTGEEIKQMLGFKTEKSKFDIKKFSLPVLSVVLGTLDGFNPCSMWSLLTLVMLALATGSRKKVWLVGGVFIVTSFVSYFLFMSAWLNALMFLKYVLFVRILVGIIAIGAGIISVKEYFTYKPNVCEASTPTQRKKISERIKRVVSLSNIPAVVTGVILIALSVNLIELMCSLGLPVAFTQALAMRNLATWKYYGYIGLYDFFYMLDDIVVVLIVGLTMKFWSGNDKYSRWSRLIAGVLMLVLGLIFLFKPSLLTF
jgi:sulfite exporter TauE/SafE